MGKLNTVGVAVDGREAQLRMPSRGLRCRFAASLNLSALDKSKAIYLLLLVHNGRLSISRSEIRALGLETLNTFREAIVSSLGNDGGLGHRH